jgi:hypothetical protein
MPRDATGLAANGEPSSNSITTPERCGPTVFSIISCALCQAGLRPDRAPPWVWGLQTTSCRPAELRTTGGVGRRLFFRHDGARASKPSFLGCDRRNGGNHHKYGEPGVSALRSERCVIRFLGLSAHELPLSTFRGRSEAAAPSTVTPGLTVFLVAESAQQPATSTATARRLRRCRIGRAQSGLSGTLPRAFCYAGAPGSPRSGPPGALVPGSSPRKLP